MSRKRLTTEEFIARAREVHGGKYDYSLVEYVDAHTKVRIICPEHGVFEQRPYDHLRGQGCRVCANKRISETRRSTIREFIVRAREVHGDKYDYSLVNFASSRAKVKIVCPEHGVFEAILNNHISKKQGCPLCFIERKRLNIREFITRAREIHGDKYDYSLVEYISNKILVKIICSKHGVFEQTPNSHLRGRGCPQCSQTGFNPLEPGTLYVLADDKQCPTLLKVGITNDLKQRLRQLQRRTPHPVVKLVSYPFPHGADAYKLEQDVHKVYHELNAGMNDFDGATEWFIFSPAILDYVNKKARR